MYPDQSVPSSSLYSMETTVYECSTSACRSCSITGTPSAYLLILKPITIPVSIDCSTYAVFMSLLTLFLPTLPFQCRGLISKSNKIACLCTPMQQAMGYTTNQRRYCYKIEYWAIQLSHLEGQNEQMNNESSILTDFTGILSGGKSIFTS